jgi:TonB family protein
MGIIFFLNQLIHSSIPRISIVMLIALACSIPAFCGEIHDAAKAGDLAKVKALLKENPELISSKSTEGFAPLHWAAGKGHKDRVELLLASKADVSVKDRFGLTPLHIAALSGHKDVVELLLANKADVNARGGFGQTPLSAAAFNGHKDVVELLLANKADVNAKENDGITPLHRAAYEGHKDVAELLLVNKAEVNAQDTRGRTPLDMAASNSRNDVMELLRQHNGGFGTGGGIGQNSEIGSGVWSGRDSGIWNGVDTSIGGSVRPYGLGDGVIAPVLLVQTVPPYTIEARKARIEGIVVLQAIIRKDGTVDRIKVLKGLGYGLDESAINTIAAWRFKPGTLNGNPVDVITNIEVKFVLF